MADPVPIVSIVNGSFGLAFKIGTVTKTSDRYFVEAKEGRTCNSVARIRMRNDTSSREGHRAMGAKSAGGNKYRASALVLGSMAISAIEEAISTRKGSATPGFLRRSKIVWQQTAFDQHQFRISSASEGRLVP